MGVTPDKSSFIPGIFYKENAWKRAQTKRKPIKLPHELVGTKTTAQVTIEGKDTNCLLDTGSQVTTVPQSFYEQHLSDLTIHPLDQGCQTES